MPLYEYTCEACGAHVEKLQNRGAEPPPTCPECSEAGTLKRGISKTSFHLKGGGWYVTDYAGAKESAPSDATASSASEAPSGEADASSPDAGGGGASDAGGGSSGDSGASTSSSGDDATA